MNSYQVWTYGPVGEEGLMETLKGRVHVVKGAKPVVQLQGKGNLGASRGIH